MASTSLSELNTVILGTGAPATVWSAADDRFDDGLEHHHHWARDSRSIVVPSTGEQHPTVADAACIRTPSTALHDDMHHAA